MSDFVAGTFAGGCGTVVGHPFDTVKVRIQFGLSNSVLSCAKQTVKNEGVRGLYKGLLPPLLADMSCNCIFFGVYGTTLQYLDPSNINHATAKLSHVYAAGAAGGFAQAFVVAPTELAKIRLQLQTSRSVESRMYKSTLDCFLKIYRKDGFRGLNTGLVATCMRTTHAFSTYMLSYQAIKRNVSQYTSNFTLTSLISGGFAGVCSWFVVYPIDVVKTKQQALISGHETIRCVTAQLYKEQGMAGFFRGMAPCLVRAFPVNAAVLVGYEWAKRILDML